MKQSFLLYWTSVLVLAVLSVESAPSYGCGKAVPRNFSAGQTTSMVIPSTKGQPVRHYKVHLPATFKNDKPHAVVFSFHGHNGDMAKQEDLSQFSDKGLLIGNAGIIAVYPQGKAGTDGETAWQGAPYSDPRVDDILFVKTMISTLEGMFCVDPSRIYAAGKSNGGGFVNLLACTPSIASKIAAFATVSAAFYTTTFNGNCPTNRAIPILDFHGTADKVAPYSGGRSHNGTLVAVKTFRQGWASRNGCQGKPAISHRPRASDPQELVEIQTWSKNCRAGSTVIGYKIKKGQHGWPRRTLPANCKGAKRKNDCTTTVFDATASVIIPFFNKYSL
ncbi:unnamed protein product [Adineta ricciae]|uniref:Feruloyl esterase n=1 Tax=Adineta ricciae TaxID=249248 RepID=A0A813RXD8_ADIRI|nr:unnamed protein product [Adineta ricciae]CAF0891126.1 unnamed protein product [Adineta ricciae]